MWEIGNIIVEPVPGGQPKIREVVQVSDRFALYAFDTNRIGAAYSTLDKLQSRFSTSDREVYANMTEYLDCTIGNRSKLWKPGVVVVPGGDIPNACLLTKIIVEEPHNPTYRYRLIDLNTGTQRGISSNSISHLISKYSDAKIYNNVTQYLTSTKPSINPSVKPKHHDNRCTDPVNYKVGNIIEDTNNGELSVITTYKDSYMVYNLTNLKPVASYSSLEQLSSIHGRFTSERIHTDINAYLEFTVSEIDLLLEVE